MVELEVALISVIIPVYNSSEFINRCLNSILSQSYQNLEIILINDGSTDASPELCEFYKRKDSRIRVLHQENKGVSAARNAGLKIASGYYISFIDSDDIIHPDFFKILLNTLESGDYDMVSCSFRMIWENNISLKFCEIKNIEKKIWFKENWFEGLLGIPINKYRNSSVPYEMVWGKIFKKTLLQDLSFENLWAEDAEFNSKVYSRLNKTVFINAPLYIWVQRPSSAHRSEPNTNIESFINTTIKTYENIPYDLRKQKENALQRVWLAILSIRYLATSFNKYQSESSIVVLKIKEIASSLQIPLLKSSYISCGFKVVIMLFYHFPLSYKIFRKAMEIYAHKKT